MGAPDAADIAQAFERLTARLKALKAAQVHVEKWLDENETGFHKTMRKNRTR